MKKTIREMLQRHIDSHDKIYLDREKIDRDPIDCIPLRLSEKLVLVQYLYDFQIDGYKIVRLKDITSVRFSDIEEFGLSILKAEGIYDQVKDAPIPNLNSWEIVFMQLKHLEAYIVIECERAGHGKLYIGKIFEIKGNSLLFLCFDAIGEWDEEPTKIAYKDITCVSFYDRYSRTISKYLKNK